MDIQTMQLSELNPAKYNPRKDLKPGDSEYDKLKRSLQEFGVVDPLVWNERTGNLVGGHQRYKVMLDLGMTETEVSIVYLDDTAEKALNIALNKISGDWDMPKLHDILQELDAADFDMDLTGFGLSELEDLEAQMNPNPIDLDDEPQDDGGKTACHCPKCGFEFEV